MVWQSVTRVMPPHLAPTAKTYTESGLPWFEYYDDSMTAVNATSTLGGLKSVTQIGAQKGEIVLPENKSVAPDNLVVFRKGLSKGQVREGAC